ncbi:AAA family ATPase [Flavobacterium sp. MMS24-S5]|uniref:AAA family ATPase n=1 Tax=Flavobacterium sp. MMS24-S5 TaxID=3416605 RepID=UPI003D000982
MIVNFTIQNFGSIKDKQELSFEATNSTDLENHYVFEPIKGIRLLKLILIYGANASGKTTVLKALEFLKDIVLNPHDKKTEKFDLHPFLFDELTPQENTILSLEFIHNKIKYGYEVELNRNAIIREELNFYNPNKANVFKRTTDINKQLTNIKFGSKISRSKSFEKSLEGNTLWNNTVLGGFLKTNIELQELKEVTDWFYESLKPLVYTKTDLESFVTNEINDGNIIKENVINILQKADFNISDIVFNEEEKEIPKSFIEFLERNDKNSKDRVAELKANSKFTTINLEFEHTVNNSKYKLPFEKQSQGTQRYYGFAGLLDLLLHNSMIIPIDELEASLHPDLYIHFLLTYLINSKESQIIATTHNREILINKDIFRNDSIWFTNKDDQNSTELYSLSDFDSKTVRDTSNIFNAYKIGKLGGIPQLGDYFLDINNDEE